MAEAGPRSDVKITMEVVNRETKEATVKVVLDQNDCSLPAVLAIEGALIGAIETVLKRQVAKV